MKKERYERYKQEYIDAADNWEKMVFSEEDADYTSKEFDKATSNMFEKAVSLAEAASGRSAKRVAENFGKAFCSLIEGNAKKEVINFLLIEEETNE